MTARARTALGLLATVLVAAGWGSSGVPKPAPPLSLPPGSRIARWCCRS